jgi:hypothetical protein
MAPEVFPKGMKTIEDIKQFFITEKIDRFQYIVNGVIFDFIKIKNEGYNRFQYVFNGVIFDYIRLVGEYPAFILVGDNNTGTFYQFDYLISIVLNVYLNGTEIQYL